MVSVVAQIVILLQHFQTGCQFSPVFGGCLKEIFRFAKPSQQEIDETVEELFRQKRMTSSSAEYFLGFIKT